MKTSFKATSANGTVITRSTKTKAYTHACIRSYRTGRVALVTWHSRLDLALAALRSQAQEAYGCPVETAVVEAIEITTAELRELKKAEHAAFDELVKAERIARGEE